jgi:hypothetical protein
MTARHATPTLDDALDVILDTLAAKLAERLDLTREREVYTSDRLPPDCRTRRRFAEICRSGAVVGARREGRCWICSRQAWERARARRPPAPATTTARIDDDADRLLSRSGLRVIGGDR